MDLRHNIIDGEPREPGGRTHFSARPGEAPLWPRSGPEDVGLALDSLGGGAGPWSALGEDRRARILEAALEGLRLDPDPGGMLARAVGLQEGEFEPPELSCPPPPACAQHRASLRNCRECHWRGEKVSLREKAALEFMEDSLHKREDRKLEVAYPFNEKAFLQTIGCRPSRCREGGGHGEEEVGGARVQGGDGEGH